MTVYPTPPSPAGVDIEQWMAAIAEIRAYCDWHIAPEVTETVTLTRSSGALVELPTMRVASVQSVTNAGVAVAAPEWDPAGLLYGSWADRRRGVVVEMTHGYAAWPPEVLKVARQIVAADGRSGVSAVTSRNHQVQFDGPGLNDEQKALLAPYRRFVV